jgi:hypothetical protein
LRFVPGLADNQLCSLSHSALSLRVKGIRTNSTTLEIFD